MKSKSTKTKSLRHIKWYRIIEHSNSQDDAAEYQMSIAQPGLDFKPVNKKFYRETSRFINKALKTDLKISYKI
jgi:hypothetical protein